MRGRALLIIGLMSLVFSMNEFVSRAAIALDGRIVSAYTTCQQPYNNRCVTHYELLSADGSHVNYDAGSNDQSLKRGLPVGTHIVKRRWDLTYLVDDKLIDDFPSYAYSALSAFGISLVSSGCFMDEGSDHALQPIQHFGVSFPTVRALNFRVLGRSARRLGQCRFPGRSQFPVTKADGLLRV
jgi:hypothetical protein